MQSTYELESVVATMGGIEAPLKRDQTGWRASVRVWDLPRGQVLVSYVATDVFGTVQTADVAFNHDNPPVITLLSPIGGAVYGLEVECHATCVDDDPGVGCASLHSYPTDPIVAGSIDGTSEVLATMRSDASTTELRTVGFKAADSAHSEATENAVIYMMPPTAPWRVAARANEPVVDFDGTRLVLRGPDNSYVLRDEDGSERNLGSSYPSSSRMVGPNSLSNNVYVYKVGDPSHGQVSNRVSGERRDIVWPVPVTLSAISPNGDVYVQPSLEAAGIVLYHAGAGGIDTIELAARPGLVLADGVQLVVDDSIYIDGRVEQLGQYDDSLVANEGWLAFRRRGPSGVLQIWTRSPAGVEGQVSFFSSASEIAFLSASGEVAFRNDRENYLAVAGHAPVNLRTGGNGTL